MGGLETIVLLVIVVVLACLTLALASDQNAGALITGLLFALFFTVFIVKMTRANHCDAGWFSQPTPTSITKTWRVDAGGHIICQSLTAEDKQ